MWNRLKRTGPGLLTTTTTVAFLLWLLVGCIIIQSYWRADHLTIRSGRQWSEWSAARGRFFVRACTLSPSATAPFRFQRGWGLSTSGSPSAFVESTRQRSQNMGAEQWRFLGFRSVRGPHAIGQTLWRHYTEGPLWPALLIPVVPVAVWFRRRRSWPTEQRRRAVRSVLLTISAVAGIPLILLVLLFVNFRFLGPQDKPLSGMTDHLPTPPAVDEDCVIVKLMTYNIHMAGAYLGGWQFESPERVGALLDDIGRLIEEQQVDIAFIQELAIDSGPRSLNQAPRLADITGMHMWAFGQCVNDGLPFYRLIDGNAIFSRMPLEPVANQKMLGRKAFYEIGTDYQSTLWCSTRIAGRDILLASVHLSSGAHDPGPQVRQLLEFADGRPAILAGDFNLAPDEPEMEPILQAPQLTARIDGDPTIYSYDPQRIIDYIFVPANWRLIEHRVIPTDLSDHLPVVCTYSVPCPVD